MEKARDVLHAYHIRVTRTSEQVLLLLQQSRCPVTVDDLYIKLRGMGINSNISTVYRVIERFWEKGLINKHAYMADGKNLYELAGEEHHHYFRCLQCGRLWAVDTCPMEEFIREWSHRSKVQVTGHKLELSGYCEKCLKKQQMNPDISKPES